MDGFSQQVVAMANDLSFGRDLASLHQRLMDKGYTGEEAHFILRAAEFYLKGK